MAWYRDFVENLPEGSRCQEKRSCASSKSGSWSAMVSRSSCQAISSGGPNGRRNARRPKSIRAISTDTLGSTAIENRSEKRAANGESPAHRSNKNRADVPDPTVMEVPMQRTGNWMTDCQNWEPPALWQKACGWPVTF